MPDQQVYYLHPLGWEKDPEEERFKVSTLDYLSVQTYNNYALFFRLADEDKQNAAEVLRAGLERTLSQARHLCGTIEKDHTGGHSFYKKKASTVQFIVQWLDSDAEYPSIDEIEELHFAAAKLGNLNTWSVPPMTYGEKPEASPDNKPVVAAYKANFVRGGLVFIMHHHHYANDVMGWAGLTHQLAENCYAITNDTPFPDWDPKNLDLSRVMRPEPPEEVKVDGPPAPQRHPDQRTGISLLFHLPKSKAAELKTMATPQDSSIPWISTYDAFSAFIFRHLTRIRAPVFNPDMSSSLFWAEAADMRRRFHSPKVPQRLQGNILSGGISATAPVTAPTISEVISEWPFWRLAAYIRELTNSISQENLDKMLDMVAMVRDKSALNIRIDAHPPMSILQTDHRDASTTGANFGFATPLTYRHLQDQVTNGVIIIYPPRTNVGNPDEGCEFAIFYEKDLAQALIDDPEWNKYFEYRGVDAIDAASLTSSS
ncbi:transferase [Aspergillus granulosus]|uniref:Transferase n=1 Tax=Aspergillus granulosus TaxID=176169 RepID=A0ABR4HSV9_9EURO